jgi:hypothetical protein
MIRTVALWICVLVSIGCQNSDRIATYETTGTVTYEDGKPIQEGSVIFIASGLPSGRGLIEDGSFSVGTYEDTDGAVAGTFQVAVIVNPPADYDPDAGKTPVAAKAKYARPETSGIEFEVKPDGANTLKIVLERGK